MHCSKLKGNIYVTCNYRRLNCFFLLLLLSRILNIVRSSLQLFTILVFLCSNSIRPHNYFHLALHTDTCLLCYISSLVYLWLRHQISHDFANIGNSCHLVPPTITPKVLSRKFFSQNNGWTWGDVTHWNYFHHHSVCIVIYLI